MKRPSRAKMCNWLSTQLTALTPIVPFNPADIQLLTQNARDAEQRLRFLAAIAAELGWHVDASLDLAWEMVREYDQRFAAQSSSSTVH